MRAFRRTFMAGIAIAAAVTVVPLSSAGASTLYVNECGTVGNLTICGTPDYVFGQLTSYMYYLTAGIITQDSILQMQNSAPGYQSDLNQLSLYVYNPTSTESTDLNLFNTEAGVFRNAQIDLPYTYTIATTDFYNATLTNPSTVWGELPVNWTLQCDEELADLAGA